MITIQFKEIVSILAARQVLCIYIYNTKYNGMTKNFISDRGLFNSIVEIYGGYYVDQLDTDDSGVISMTLIKPEDLKEYVKNMEKPLEKYE